MGLRFWGFWASGFKVEGVGLWVLGLGLTVLGCSMFQPHRTFVPCICAGVLRLNLFEGSSKDFRPQATNQGFRIFALGLRPEKLQ